MQEEEKSDGFKFALTALTALGTIIYIIYNYFQNTSVDDTVYTFTLTIIPVLIVSIILFIVYVLIKGFSMEMQNPWQKKNMEKLASKFYLIALWITILAFILFFSVFLQAILNFSGYFFAFIAILISLSGYAFYRKYIERQNSFQKTVVSIIFLSIIFAWFIVFLPVSYFIHGHVTDDMKSIYYKNNVPIPISIEVTGPNTELQINLYQINSEYKLTLIDSLKFGPKHVLDKKVNGTNSILVGNAFDSGKYNVFINTTNPSITVGYYELVYSRFNYDYGKSFYLLNASEAKLLS
jgi:hypothetical protein